MKPSSTLRLSDLPPCLLFEEENMAKCKCFEQANEKLVDKGIKLSAAMTLNFTSGRVEIEGPLLAVEWIGKKLKSASLPAITCKFCPICGVKR